MIQENYKYYSWRLWTPTVSQRLWQCLNEFKIFKNKSANWGFLQPNHDKTMSYLGNGTSDTDWKRCASIFWSILNSPSRRLQVI